PSHHDKKGWRGETPAFQVNQVISLEVDLRSDLSYTRPSAWAARNAEVEQIGHIRPGWGSAKTEVRAVEDIEELATNLEIDRFPDPCAFDESHVVVVVVRVTQLSEIRRGVSQLECARDGEEVVVQPWR